MQSPEWNVETSWVSMGLNMLLFPVAASGQYLTAMTDAAERPAQPPPPVH